MSSASSCEYGPSPLNPHQTPQFSHTKWSIRHLLLLELSLKKCASSADACTHVDYDHEVQDGWRDKDTTAATVGCRWLAGWLARSCMSAITLTGKLTYLHMPPYKGMKNCKINKTFHVKVNSKESWNNKGKMFGLFYNPSFICLGCKSGEFAFQSARRRLSTCAGLNIHSFGGGGGNASRIQDEMTSSMSRTIAWLGGRTDRPLLSHSPNTPSSLDSAFLPLGQYV